MSLEEGIGRFLKICCPGREPQLRLCHSIQACHIETDPSLKHLSSQRLRSRHMKLLLI